MTGPSDELAFSALFWPILEAARPLLPPTLPPELVAGLLGVHFLSATAEPIYADLETLIVPGLRIAGIEAVVSALGDDALRIPDSPPCPSARTRVPGLGDSISVGAGSDMRAEIGSRSNLMPAFGFHGEPFSDEADDAEAEDEAETVPVGRSAARDLERTLAASRLIAAPPKRLGSATNAVPIADGFSWAVRLRQSEQRWSRRSALLAAIRNATVFAIAYPGRRVSGRDRDAAQRSHAAAFLFEAAGRLRDSVSLRWRRAGESMAAGDASGAVFHLYDALLVGMDLPPAIRAALARPLDAPISALQRRELIYLARAGNRDLRVLAAARLATVRGHSDVRRTLEQLARTGDPFVRAVAGRAFGEVDLRSGA